MSGDDTRLPKLVAFDLDYTLWGLYIDCCMGPLRREGNALNHLTDKYGDTIGFYRDVPQILHSLSAANVHVAAASRTSAIDLANEALSKLLLPPPKGAPKDTAPRKANSFFDTKEIYPTSKIKHFKELYRKTGIPYDEMLFFDDEPRNKEVESLGVTFVLVRNGMDNKTYVKGLAEWHKRHPKKALPTEEDLEEEDA